MQCIVDDQRDQLLRELVRSVVVGAIGDVDMEMADIYIGPHQHVRACLTCGVRTVGIIGYGLIEEGIAIIGEISVETCRNFLPSLKLPSGCSQAALAQFNLFLV